MINLSTAEFGQWPFHS